MSGVVNNHIIFRSVITLAHCSLDKADLPDLALLPGSRVVAGLLCLLRLLLGRLEPRHFLGQLAHFPGGKEAQGSNIGSVTLNSPGAYERKKYIGS